MPEEEPRISYSVREMLSDLGRKMDQLLDAMGRKADRADVVELEERIGRIDDRLTRLEHEHRLASEFAHERTEHRRWLIPTIAAVATAIGGLGLIYATLHPH